MSVDPESRKVNPSPLSSDRTTAEGAPKGVESSGSTAASQPGQGLAEAEWVAQAKVDPQAFGVLYERYVDRIYAYIFHRIHNQQEAEDLTARTFYRALSRLYTYEDRGLPFSAWLYRIAHNLVANWHRDQGRRRFLSLDDLRLPGLKRAEPEVVVAQIEENEALWAAIDRLPEDRRDLLIYKFGNHLSNLEIGSLMGKSEGAIKSLYFRTLSALRRDLQARDWDRQEEDTKDGNERNG
ncbi:MAG: sigma-70 family RNA polymerase sigma factor [Caldilineaceae bacterium]|nr:sigma-70 family RNA polymerase sigma factor [Caldilineaceae bacterium]